LNDLFTLLVARPRPGATFNDLNESLQQRQCRLVRLLPPYVDPQAAALTRPESSTRIRVAVPLLQHVIDVLQNITVSVCRGGRIDFDPVKAQAEEVLRRLQTDDGLLLGLARQDQYDAFTFGHSARVAVLSLRFARALTDDQELLLRVG